MATVQADAFCHNMVRALVGSALYVGEGVEERPEWLHERLLAKKRDARSVLAAPHPLVLEEVAYPSDDETAGPGGADEGGAEVGLAVLLCGRALCCTL